MKEKKLSISRYIIPIIGFTLVKLVFDFWMENGSGCLYKWFEIHLPSAFTNLLYFSFIVLMFLFIYTTMRSYYLREIEIRDEKLKDEARIIWERYSDLYRYKTNDVIQKVMDQFLQNEPYVLAVQLYEYSIKYIEQEVVFKITHRYGRVNEGIDINAMSQTYYRVDKKNI